MKTVFAPILRSGPESNPVHHPAVGFSNGESIAALSVSLAERSLSRIRWRVLPFLRTLYFSDRRWITRIMIT